VQEVKLLSPAGLVLEQGWQSFEAVELRRLYSGPDAVFVSGLGQYCEKQDQSSSLLG